MKKPAYETVTDAEGLQRVLASLRAHEGRSFAGFDTEFFGPLQEWVEKKEKRVVDPVTAKLAGVSFAVGQQAWYIVVDHVSSQVVPRDAFLQFMKDVQSLDLRFWAHNAYVDLLVLKNNLGYMPRFRRFGDSMLLLHRVQAGIVKRTKKDGSLQEAFALKEMVLKMFGHKMVEYSEAVAPRVLLEGPTDEEIAVAIATGFMAELSARGMSGAAVDRIFRTRAALRKQQVWYEKQANEADLAKFGPYACEDAYWSLQIAEEKWPELEDFDYYDHWDATDQVLPYYQAEMYEAGLLIDKDYLALVEREVRPRLDGWKSDWESKTGAAIGSSKQCVKAVYGGDNPLWEPSEKTLTKKGGLSVGKEAVADVLARTDKDSESYRLALLKLDYNKYSSLLSKLDKEFIVQLTHRTDGRLRTNFSFVGTETGRVSSFGPNMTNLPKPSDDPLTMRNAVIARPGYSIVAMDFSQLELVIMAHMSGSKVLCQAINEGRDMHAANAAAMGVSRNMAKTGVYAIMYGGREKRISEALGCTKEEATSFLKSFYDANPEVAAFGDFTVQKLKLDGFAESIALRRRHIPAIWAVDEHKRNPKVLKDRALEYLNKRKWDTSPANVDKQAMMFARMDAMGAERQAVNFRIQGSAADIVLRTMADLYRALLPLNWPVYPLLQVHDELVHEVRDDYVERFEALVTDTAKGSWKLSVPLSCEVKHGKTYAKCK